MLLYTTCHKIDQDPKNYKAGFPGIMNQTTDFIPHHLIPLIDDKSRSGGRQKSRDSALEKSCLTWLDEWRLTARWNPCPAAKDPVETKSKEDPVKKSYLLFNRMQFHTNNCYL